MMFALGGIKPTLPECGDFWVADGAQVIGDVLLEAGCSVWFNAVLRGDNERISVGAGSNIQDGVICHTDPGFPLSVGRNCTIGHMAILHGCTIGQDSLVGMGSVVLNGAVLGNSVLLGAGALVTEGREIPDATLAIGRPAKPVRDLTEAELIGLEASASRYYQKMLRFREEIARIPETPA